MSPLGSIPGQDLSTTLIKLANIQSRSLEMMAASQQEAFNKLTKASKAKANNAMDMISGWRSSGNQQEQSIKWL